MLIKHYFLRQKTAKETKEKLDKYYGESAPSKSMVCKWFAEFKNGRTSTIDEPRSGRPNDVTTPEMVDKIHDIVLADRRVKLRDIVDIVNISSKRVFNILHEYLDIKKLSAKWVPRFLTIDQKRNRVTTSKQVLELLQRNPIDFWRRFITWIHDYTPEIKEQSKQWISTGEKAPKKAKTVPSASKIMATVF